jgi:hypothetical protein
MSTRQRVARDCLIQSVCLLDEATMALGRIDPSGDLLYQALDYARAALGHLDFILSRFQARACDGESFASGAREE